MRAVVAQTTRWASPSRPRHAGVVGRQDPGGGQGLRQLGRGPAAGPPRRRWRSSWTAATVSRCPMPCGPPPNATTRSGSSRRSSQGLTAATETAGVRRLVSATPSSRWVGRSVAASNNTYAALIRGSPRAGLPGATVGELDPDGRRALGGHQQQIALLQRYAPSGARRPPGRHRPAGRPARPRPQPRAAGRRRWWPRRRSAGGCRTRSCRHRSDRPQRT